VTAAGRPGNVLAGQFHPEKSGRHDPAIDVRGGRVVRLRQGDFDQETEYGTDAVAVAAGFVEAGASWVHLVDLDAARTGQRWNHDVIAAVARALGGRASLQVGGGVRAVADAEALATLGVARVVMGSAAVRHPEVVARVSAVVPVAVGLDHRSGELALDGWTERAGLRVDTVLDRYPDASAFVVTDIGRDGTLAGPDVAGLAVLAGRSPVPIIASGGVASLDDLRRLAGIPDLAGAIVGRALYEGRFDVAEALAVVESG
jgi:phosphoribosylformimino-5-aminoimidazole carboxamide ribotide isomerase